MWHAVDRTVFLSFIIDRRSTRWQWTEDNGHGGLAWADSSFHDWAVVRIRYQQSKQLQSTDELLQSTNWQHCLLVLEQQNTIPTQNIIIIIIIIITRGEEQLRDNETHRLFGRQIIMASHLPRSTVRSLLTSLGWGPITRLSFPREAFPREDAQGVVGYVCARCDSRAEPETYPLCIFARKRFARKRSARYRTPTPVYSSWWI